MRSRSTQDGTLASVGISIQNVLLSQVTPHTRRIPTTHNAGGVFVSGTPSFDEDEDGAKKIATAALNE